MAVFTILFGLQRLDPTERHPGLLTSLALESISKLGIFLFAGVVITTSVFGNGQGLIEAIRNQPLSEINMLGNASPSEALNWLTYLVLSAGAFALLPRQYHVGVVENASPGHLRTALWLVPLYLLLINLFVIPIALAGWQLGIKGVDSDNTLLAIPLLQGRPLLSLAVFLGGLSAAVGMIVLESVALATMVANHLMLPLFERIRWFQGMRSHLLASRWIAAAGFILLSWCFEISAGQSVMLVSMGILSFAAVLQFAPATLGALLWRQGSRTGAVAGIVAGFLIWFWTLLLPTMVQSGWMNGDLLAAGPFGIHWLRPEALLGLDLLPPLTHGVFWSLSINSSLFLVGSLLFPNTREEQRLALEFCSEETYILDPSQGPATISLEEKVSGLEQLIATYHSPDAAAKLMQRCLENGKLIGKEHITVVELVELQEAVEHLLAGAIGSAAAHRAIQHYGGFQEGERHALTAVYGRILCELTVSPADLKRRIDFYMEREGMLVGQAEELVHQVQERTRELSAANERLKSEVVEKEQAQESLVAAQQELLVGARQAGRAKIATNVLHNVGNVLNSINVGVSEISTRLHRMHLEGLSKAASLIGEAADPVALRRDDEKGRLLPRDFLKLSSVLEQERRELLGESEQLRLKVDHVNEIVRLQQSSASVKDRPERGTLACLIEDALLLTDESLKRHEIQVVLELESLPELSLHRHKLIQILVNLIQNAKDAMIDPRAVGQTLTIRGRRSETGRLVIEVADQGCGIPPDDLVRIFQHGYTTRAGGHGFGLHGSALAAQGLGGALLATSGGIGAGASFQLEVPIVEAKAT